MKQMTCALSTAALSLLSGIAFAQGGLAKTSPGFSFPFDPAVYRMTAAFDLDRDTGTLADWTGWVSGDPTAGNGHAYDNHSGTDNGMGTGTSLRAIADGTVTSLYEDYPTDDHSGGGNYMFFSHAAEGETYRVNFWHLDYQGALKSAGQSVTRGEVVALSDNTGNSTGPHLHFGISRSSANDQYTCAYYHGWWEADEFYYGNTRPCLAFVEVNTGVTALNCRAGTSTAYDIVTQVTGNHLFVSPQENSWWRVFLPMPPATVHESRTSTGSAAPDYSESGTWVDSAAKSTVADAADDANRVVLTGGGARYSEFTGTGGADSATFSFTPTQRGSAELFATYPTDANATGVTYRITHLGGTTDVVLDQNGSAGVSGGTGTHADPYLIGTQKYVATHTTVGGDDTWDSYSPTGSGVPENGPERLYRFTVSQPQNVTITVDHTGYPSRDVDIHLLSALANTSCVARNDWSLTHAVTPGTWWIAVDSYGTDNSAASPYTITVEFEKESFPNSWVSLGEYSFDRAVPYSVQILESSVTGRPNTSLPGRVYADAIKVQPKLTYRSGWLSNSFVTRVSTASTPVCSIVVEADSLEGDDSRDIDDYAEFPVYAAPGLGASNASPIVAKVVTGQRFVCTERTADGWYKIHLTTGQAAEEGWIGGQPLYIFNESAATLVTPSEVEAWSAY
ncbi:MAG: hypothetical protein PWP23_690 [Candidatus Sumerlaeota bacterium]|nr:hypothetical protein [Candidatus Sumerlaeota bacterium]